MFGLISIEIDGFRAHYVHWLEYHSVQRWSLIDRNIPLPTLRILWKSRFSKYLSYLSPPESLSSLQTLEIPFLIWPLENILHLNYFKILDIFFIWFSTLEFKTGKPFYDMSHAFYYASELYLGYKSIFDYFPKSENKISVGKSRRILALLHFCNPSIAQIPPESLIITY